jgi:hypothetical protein
MEWRLWVLLLLVLPLPAPATWSFETSFGSAYNADSRLRIEQAGAPVIRHLADYATRPFDTPLYYQLRVARADTAGAWELSLIHDKIYVRNPPPGVDYLSISHGLNFLTLNRAHTHPRFTHRVGAGVIVTNAEGRVRGVTYDGPYDLAGVVLLAGLSKRFYLQHRWFIVGDITLTLGYANADADGQPPLRIEVPHAGAHGSLGLGYDF